MICLDTNYLILGLVAGSRESSELTSWIAAGEQLITPSLAWFEFRCGPISDPQVETMRAFVHQVVPFGETHAVAAASLFNLAARKRSTRVDAMIAATALVADAALATNNKQDFRAFRQHGLRLI
ncbi:MAG TPA: PIN domain-containing protein [Gemmatimonas sp.]|nr:PIN domain-containing protein [Gemmatimonas sp.]